MFSFFNSKKTTIPAPDWAFFLMMQSIQNLSLKLKLILNLRGINLRYQMVSYVNKNEFGFENLGLSNVAQVCKQHGVNH
ncbi:MAG: hypothetical protein IPI31_09685 [Bacteroidetes bacterium]|nr:hypothetical protein [Bacteroidota bacterium]